jgi:hypothetical protein
VACFKLNSSQQASGINSKSFLGNIDNKLGMLKINEAYNIIFVSNWKFLVLKFEKKISLLQFCE